MIKKRLIFLTDQTRKYILLGVLFHILALTTRIISVFQIGDLLNAVLRKRPAEPLIYRVSSVILICFVLHAVFVRLSIKMNARSVSDIGRTIRMRIYDKTIKLGAAYREKVQPSEILYLSSDGVPLAEAFYEKFIPQLIRSIAVPVVLFIFMAAAVNFRAAMVILLCTPILTIAGFMVMRAAKNIRTAYHDDFSNLREHFTNNLRGLTTLKLYRADDIKADEMTRESEEYRITAMRMFSIQLAEEGLTEFLAVSGCIIGILVGITEFVYGTFSLTGCIMIILLAADYFIPAVKVCGMLKEADSSVDVIDRLRRFLETDEPLYGNRSLNVPLHYSETEEVALADQDRYSRPRFLKKSGISYTLSDVHFAYDRGREILHGVDMVLPPASFTSLVGPSGSGKSTIAEMLCGRLKNYKGEIRIDCDGSSVNLYDVKEDDLFSHVILIKSSSHLFEGTVAENLRMAKKDADDQELLDALDAVDLLPYIKKHEGLDTMIKSRAANLSAGQAQRLAVARALLMDAEVLIFDEATSNIDAESETCIMRVIRDLSTRKTVLLISHRLSNVTESDCIYVMDNGMIRESGTHEELLKKKGIYNTLYTAQKTFEDYSVRSRLDGKDQQFLQISGAHVGNASGHVTDSESVTENGSDQSADKAAGSPEKRRHSLPVLLYELTGLASPSFSVILLASLLRVAADLCLIFIPFILGGTVLKNLAFVRSDEFFSSPVARYFQLALILLFLRLVCSSAWKYLSRRFAYSILFRIRYEVYTTLRRLAPARFEKKDQSDLIRILMDDIEQLENLYGHIIGPLLSTLVTSGIIIVYLWKQHTYAGILALTVFAAADVLIPWLKTRRTYENALLLRRETGKLGSFLLDQLNGVAELQQFGNTGKGRQDLTARSVAYAEAHEQYVENTAFWTMLRASVIFLGSAGMFFLMILLCQNGMADAAGAAGCTLLIMYSLMLIPSLSGMSGDFGRALAGGDRILSILEERPAVLDVSEAEGKLGWDGYKRFHGAEMSRVTFAYDEETVLNDFTILLWPKQLIGIHGPSGCGKSTVLKLLQRFWDVDKGSVSICGEDIRNIATRRLRDAESYMAQETVIFHDSIANNIAIGKPGASRVEIIRAAKKAALHDFILSLPRGYDTQIDELGNRLSDGEIKRIGIARAFLHNAPLILLDEPTGHLDSLNEGMILKALAEEGKERTIVIASSRNSAMMPCDTVFEMQA